MTPYKAALDAADKAAQATFSLLNVDTIDDIDEKSFWLFADDVEDRCNELNRSHDYIDPVAVRHYILSEGVKDIEWVGPLVDRLNLAIFTNSVWSDRYDEAIAVFFLLVIPQELHERDDIIELFLDVVTRWAVRHMQLTMTTTYTTRDVIGKMKRQLHYDLEDEDEALCMRISRAMNRRFDNIDSTPLHVFEETYSDRRVKEAWFKLFHTILDIIDSKVDQQVKADGIDTDTGNDDNQAKASETDTHTGNDNESNLNAESDNDRGSQFYDALSSFYDNDNQEESNDGSMEEELDELMDEHDSPDKPSTGMKRSHDQTEDGIVSDDKHNRPEPMVISAPTHKRVQLHQYQEEDNINAVESEPIDTSESSESEQDQGSPRDGNNQDENNDTSNAWGEDNGSDIESDYRDETPLSAKGDYHPPLPPYLHRRSTSGSPSVSLLRFEGKSSSACSNHEHQQSENDGDRHDTSLQVQNESDDLVQVKIEGGANDSDRQSDNRMESGSSNQQETLPFGLRNTTNYGPASPILEPVDQPMSTSVAEHTRQIRQRGDVARGGTTRGRNYQPPPYDISNSQQQDDQLNSQSTTDTIDAPATRRNRPRRDLPILESNVAPSTTDSEQDLPRLRKLNEYWTDEEIEALDEGLRLYNKRWAFIKAKYAQILYNRTNVQLKDKARNIARQRRKQGQPLEHYQGCG